MNRWKTINLKFGPIYGNKWDSKTGHFFGKDTFYERKLNKPGTLIELKNGKQYLIGDINEYIGICDDCTAFDCDTIVKRYKIIYKK